MNSDAKQNPNSKGSAHADPKGLIGPFQTSEEGLIVFVCNFRVFDIFGRKRAHGEAGGVLKRFLEAIRFILAEFGPKPSHGDPIRDQKYGFGTYDMC